MEFLKASDSYASLQTMKDQRSEVERLGPKPLLWAWTPKWIATLQA
jgi:hypothetical protein